jgi:hypothetical protein
MDSPAMGPKKRHVKKFLTVFLLGVFYCSFLGLPSEANLASSSEISSKGLILYPQLLNTELGAWMIGDTIHPVPNEATWVVASTPDYRANRGNISVILNWRSVHPPENPFNPFTTSAEIQQVEGNLTSIPAENFWGIIFVCEETYRTHVAFDDDVNTTWFGENLLGYPLYLTENPTATQDQWKDEMYFRMIRGFYNYFHPRTKIGITANGMSTILNWKNTSPLKGKGVPYFFGEEAMDFIKQNYDFVILYAYTSNLTDYDVWTRQYFSFIDATFQNQKKFWILTRVWDYNQAYWETEAIALEIKNCLDRGIAITTYYWSTPPIEETWPLILKAVALYNAKLPYYESDVYGTNLLTGYVGNTYGWVDVASQMRL